MSHAAASHATPHKHPNYIAIFVVLTVLTIVEVILAYTLVHVSVLLTTLLLLALSAVKAILVALYYMHMSDEGALIWAAAITPFVMAIIILVAAGGDVTAASFSRSTVKYSQIAGDNAHGGSHGGGHAEAAPAAAAPRPIAAPVSAAAAAAPVAGGAPVPAATGSVAAEYFAGPPSVGFINPDVSFYNK